MKFGSSLTQIWGCSGTWQPYFAFSSSLTEESVSGNWGWDPEAAMPEWTLPPSLMELKMLIATVVPSQPWLQNYLKILSWPEHNLLVSDWRTASQIFKWKSSKKTKTRSFPFHSHKQLQPAWGLLFLILLSPGTIFWSQVIAAQNCSPEQLWPFSFWRRRSRNRRLVTKSDHSAIKSMADMPEGIKSKCK